MIPNDRLMQITERFEFLEARMGEGLGGDEFVAVSREYAELRPVVEVVQAYQGLVAEIEGAEAMLDDLHIDSRDLSNKKAGILPFVSLAAGIAVALIANQIFTL